MKTVYKYPIDVTVYQKLFLPKGSQILSVQLQHALLFVWAFVDDKESELEVHEIICHGTGHDASDVTPNMFIGTVQLYGGNLVFHFFDKQKVLGF